ncbi:hypothetical protein B9W64_07125 [Streptomyces sp. CS159]|nr:hypothetical protein B9W64_07125 [Streptomyces sp. CS159]
MPAPVPVPVPVPVGLAPEPGPARRRSTGGRTGTGRRTGPARVDPRWVRARPPEGVGRPGAPDPRTGVPDTNRDRAVDRRG